MSKKPRFEDVADVSDAVVQGAIAALPNEILAAALLGAPDSVASKLVNNLSPRRRKEVSAAAQPFPQRTREVARKVLLKKVFELKEEEERASAPASPDSPRKRDLQAFLGKLAQRHPQFLEAQRERESALFSEYLKKLFGSE